ncbi:hypothetical protein MMC17_005509 [Xylographa soralifera]|nr:hypothetical protein [Xylographa soralifera]
MASVQRRVEKPLCMAEELLNWARSDMLGEGRVIVLMIEVVVNIKVDVDSAEPARASELESDEVNKVVENGVVEIEYGVIIVVFSARGEGNDGASPKDDEERTDAGVAIELMFEMFEAEVVASVEFVDNDKGVTTY